MIMNKNILVIDDDPISLKILCSALEKHGFRPIKAENGNDALTCLKEYDIGAVVLDMNLPDINGLEVMKLIRKHPVYKSIAIIIVTNNDDKLDAILGLEMGADDYITKPFHQREFIARLNAVLRRTQYLTNGLSPYIVFDDLEIDIGRRLVKKNGKPISLSFKEFEILVLLSSNPGKVISREKILNVIGGLTYSPETRNVDMHIASIRRKLGDTGKVKKYIDTVSGIGYRFRE